MSSGEAQKSIKDKGQAVWAKPRPFGVPIVCVCVPWCFHPNRRAHLARPGLRNLKLSVSLQTFETVNAPWDARGHETQEKTPPTPAVAMKMVSNYGYSTFHTQPRGRA